MCQTFPQHSSRSGRSVSLRTHQVHRFSRRTGRLSRTQSGYYLFNNKKTTTNPFVITHLDCKLLHEKSCLLTLKNNIVVCRIISTCGELLRQCGAFEQQLSNKWVNLFTEWIFLPNTIISFDSEHTVKKLIWNFKENVYFAICPIGSWPRQVSTCQSRTAHAAWQASRRPLPQKGRVPPKTLGKNTTTFRGEMWLNTTIWWNFFTR